MTAMERKLSDNTTLSTDAALASSASPTCGRPRFREGWLPLLSLRMPSAIRSDEMADMVEWLRPVSAAIAVRDTCPVARRTAEMTSARLRRRRSSWRTPTVILPIPPTSSLFRDFQGGQQQLNNYWKPFVLSLFISRCEKNVRARKTLLTVLGCWVSIFSKLEKKLQCRYGFVRTYEVAPYAAQGGNHEEVYCRHSGGGRAFHDARVGCAGERQDRRRILVQFPGRALEDRRSRHQEGSRSQW